MVRKHYTDEFRRRPWKGFDDLEIATAEWVDWFNHVGRASSSPPAPGP
jgi:hypothetical protein